MKTLCASVVIAVFMLGPVSALADTWGEPINEQGRFKVLEKFNDEAVLDRETGLIWEQSPSTKTQKWLDAQSVCNRVAVGNRRGWRLPTIQELASLVDPARSNPSLPPGASPGIFTDVQVGSYWSATTSAADAGDAWRVDLSDGLLSTIIKTTQIFFWCVRGGQGVDPQ